MSGFICTIFRFMSARLVQNVGGIFFFPQAGRSLLRLGQNCQDCFILSAKRVVDVPGRAQRMLASVEFDAAFMTVATLCAAISSSTGRRLA